MSASRGEPSAGVLSRAPVRSRSAWAVDRWWAQADEAAPGNAGAMVMGGRHTGKLFQRSNETSSRGSAELWGASVHHVGHARCNGARCIARRGREGSILSLGDGTSPTGAFGGHSGARWASRASSRDQIRVWTAYTISYPTYGTVGAVAGSPRGRGYGRADPGLLQADREGIGVKDCPNSVGMCSLLLNGNYCEHGLHSNFQ